MEWYNWRGVVWYVLILYGCLILISFFYLLGRPAIESTNSRCKLMPSTWANRAASIAWPGCFWYAAFKLYSCLMERSLFDSSLVCSSSGPSLLKKPVYFILWPPWRKKDRERERAREGGREIEGDRGRELILRLGWRQACMQCILDGSPRPSIQGLK